MFLFIKKLYKKLFRKSNVVFSVHFNILKDKQIDIGCFVPDQDYAESNDTHKDAASLIMHINNGVLSSYIINLLKKNNTKLSNDIIEEYSKNTEKDKEIIKNYYNEIKNSPVVPPSRVFSLNIRNHNT